MGDRARLALASAKADVVGITVFRYPTGPSPPNQDEKDRGPRLSRHRLVARRFSFWAHPDDSTIRRQVPETMRRYRHSDLTELARG